MQEEQQKEQKDFLIELAKGIDLLDNCGLKAKLQVEFILQPAEFDRAINRLSKKIIIYGDIPANDFKINFSGVEVTFKKENAPS